MPTKKLMPILAIIGFVVVVVLGSWYEISLSKPSSIPDSSTLDTTAGLSGKTVSDAAKTAGGFVNTLKVNGKVPLDSSGIPRNPDPLFSSAQ